MFLGANIDAFAAGSSLGFGGQQYIFSIIQLPWKIL
jgi:hypothetical protein